MRKRWFPERVFPMKQKIIRAGRHSLSVVVPAKFVHALGVHAGETVEVNSDIESGIISLQFKGALQLRLPTDKKKNKL